MPRAKRATLTDVARLAGVSVTTASYILNGRTTQMRISDDTAAKVRVAMEQLDYRPNRSAQNLRRSRTQTIGVISDFVASGAFATQMLTGASAAARALDHLLVIGETLGDPAVEELLIRELVDRQVDGIVYLTVAASLVTVPEALRERPTVLLNCRDDDHDLPAVLPDDEAGGRAAAQHLLAAGWVGPSGSWATTSPSGPPLDATGCAGSRVPSTRPGCPWPAWCRAPGTSPRRAPRCTPGWVRAIVRRRWSASTTGSPWGPTRRWPS